MKFLRGKPKVWELVLEHPLTVLNGESVVGYRWELQAGYPRKMNPQSFDSTQNHQTLIGSQNGCKGETFEHSIPFHAQGTSKESAGPGLSM